MSLLTLWGREREKQDNAGRIVNVLLCVRASVRARSHDPTDCVPWKTSTVMMKQQVNHLAPVWPFSLVFSAVFFTGLFLQCVFLS